jgi:hypothetical protein
MTTLLTYCGGDSKVESLKEESISMVYPRISDLLLSGEPCGIGHEIMKLPTRVKICYARVKSSCREGKLFKT